MKLKKSIMTTLCGAALMGMAAGAQAILFQFNPTGAGLGSGLINGAATLDQAPGNDLALNGSGAGAALPVGTTITDLYQANLNSVLGATSNNLYANGAVAGGFFTFVASFSEQVISATGGVAPNNAFNILPGGFFSMCAHTAAGLDGPGTGFGCANVPGSSPILSGHAIGGNATQTTFPASPLQPLDQSPNGVDSQPGVTTVTSSGSANLTLQVDAVNAGYFPDLIVGSLVTISLTNTSNITPFNQVDPSLRFSAGGVTDDTNNNIGAVNGFTGPNFQFQADANSAFLRAVPEPGTLALLGLTAVAMGAFFRRRTKAY